MKSIVSSGRVIESIDDEFIQVEEFGAVGNGTTDDTAAFQTAVNSGHNIYAGNKTYAIDGTILVAWRQSLTLASGAVLKRRAAASSTLPIVRISGQQAILDGNGKVWSEKASPLGVVQIGHAIGSDGTNILWNTVSGVSIEGNSGAGSIGLNITSNQPALSSTGVNYANTVTGLNIRNVEIGVELGEMCNAHSITDVNLYNLNTGGTGYSLVGALENNIKGGFTHFSSGATILKLRQGIVSGANESTMNVFTSVMAEPGGSSRLYDIGSGCNYNTIIGHDNNSQGSIDNGVGNGGIINGRSTKERVGSSTWDPPSVAAGAVVTTVIVVPGAVLGEVVNISFSNDVGSCMLDAHVPYVGHIQVKLFNPTGAAIDLGSGTLRWIRTNIT